MENTNMTANLVTPINAAKALNKAPQYIYQLLRDGKIPSEHLVAIPKGDGTMRELLKESFFVWFESRPSFRTASAGRTVNPVETRQATVDELLVAMAAKLEESGNKKFLGLAEALKTACASAVPAPEVIQNDATATV
jgi:hypothetical protein